MNTGMIVQNNQHQQLADPYRAIIRVIPCFPASHAFPFPSTVHINEPLPNLDFNPCYGRGLVGLVGVDRMSSQPPSLVVNTVEKAELLCYLAQIPPPALRMESCIVPDYRYIRVVSPANDRFTDNHLLLDCPLQRLLVVTHPAGDIQNFVILQYRNSPHEVLLVVL